MMQLPGNYKGIKPKKQSDPKIRLLVILAFGSFLLIVAVSILYNILYPPVWTEQLAIDNATGQKLTITNYRYATNVSYEKLTRFLANDTTDMVDYVFPNYTCGDFAVHLHDDAETSGIKCGIVGVALNTTGYTGMDTSHLIPAKIGASNDSDSGHGFVVFNTTDMGLIYIDPTGVTGTEKIQGRHPHYMVVYFLQGSTLGEISINQSERLDYDYYHQKESLYEVYVNDILDFDKQVSAYNADRNAYNSTLANYDSDRESFIAEYVRYKAELDDLNDSNVSGQQLPEQLDIWKTGLDDWQKALELKQLAIFNQSEQLDAEKQRLNEKRASIQQSEEANWEMTTSLGVVDNVVIDW